MPENATYPHHESALSWRTAENSAAYLIKYLQPSMHILDIGFGPGTITASLACLVPQGRVTGIEYASEDSKVFHTARKHAAEQGVTNISFAHGDIHNLEGIPDNTYDVVHCHQVLTHISDPVQALKEMRRVAKPGGLVAAREWDAKTVAWYPETDRIDEWVALYRVVGRANGGEPDAGRRLVSWALAAGFERAAIDATAGASCFSTPAERAWFAEVQAVGAVQSTFAMQAVEKGLTDMDGLQRIAGHWRAWATREDGWFAVFNGEIVCRV